jgi:hypothetical protein
LITAESFEDVEVAGEISSDPSLLGVLLAESASLAAFCFSNFRMTTLF